MKHLFIVNPVAGRSAYKPNFAEATLLLAQAGYRVDLYYTAARGDANSEKWLRENGRSIER